jgi:hypothetical protein
VDLLRRGRFVKPYDVEIRDWGMLHADACLDYQLDMSILIEMMASGSGLVIRRTSLGIPVGIPGGVGRALPSADQLDFH